MPSPLVNITGDRPFKRYNVAPSTQLALSHQEGNNLHADMVRWGWWLHWAKDRAAPTNIRIEKVAPALSSARFDRTGQSLQSTTGLPHAEHEPSEHDGFVIITADSAGGMVDINVRKPIALSPELVRK
ncbi:hypothetical protein PS893_00053 [Pseudomonas fluorescens]|nr:hypothetical protein PS893_00053 [Pseudomonas fluorescens]